MRLFAVTLVTLLCLAAAPRHVEARQKTGAQPGEGGGQVDEALGLLASRLRGLGEVASGRDDATTRVGSVRFEGCVLRYKVTSERATYGPPRPGRPQVSADDYVRTVYEWTVNLALLDPARVWVSNPLRMRKGGAVLFSAADGSEPFTRQWVEHSRAGPRVRTDRPRGGSFMSDDAGSLEELAAAVRRAVGVCRGAAP